MIKGQKSNLLQVSVAPKRADHKSLSTKWKFICLSVQPDFDYKMSIVNSV